MSASAHRLFGPWVRPLVVEPAVNLTPPTLCSLSSVERDLEASRELSLIGMLGSPYCCDAQSLHFSWGLASMCYRSSLGISSMYSTCLGRGCLPVRVSDVVKAHPQGFSLKPVCKMAGSQWLVTRWWPCPALDSRPWFWASGNNPGSWRGQLWFGLALDEATCTPRITWHNLGRRSRAWETKIRGLVYLALAKRAELGCEQRPRVNKGFAFFCACNRHWDLCRGEGLQQGPRLPFTKACVPEL